MTEISQSVADSPIRPARGLPGTRKLLGFFRGAFARIEPTDITMEGYDSHAPIKAPMAA